MRETGGRGEAQLSADEVVSRSLEAFSGLHPVAFQCGPTGRMRLEAKALGRIDLVGLQSLERKGEGQFREVGRRGRVVADFQECVDLC